MGKIFPNWCQIWWKSRFWLLAIIWKDWTSCQIVLNGKLWQFHDSSKMNCTFVSKRKLDAIFLKLGQKISSIIQLFSCKFVRNVSSLSANILQNVKKIASKMYVRIFCHFHMMDWICIRENLFFVWLQLPWWMIKWIMFYHHYSFHHSKVLLQYYHCQMYSKT